MPKRNNTQYITADMTAYHIARYQKNVRDGKCPTCEKEKEKDGFVICAKCRQQNRKYKLTKEKQLEYNQNYYNKKVKNGLCVHCGKQPPAPDRKLCRNCLDKANERRIVRDL